MVALPLGPLLSFGTIIFDETRTTEPLNYRLEWISAYETGAGAFPIDKRGLSDAPKKQPQATWKYVLTAAPGLEGPDAYASVEQGLADIVSALETPYSYAGPALTTSATVSGQVGDLVVLRANQTDAVQCFARCEMLDVAVKAGHPYSLELPLTFALLTPWQDV